MAEPASPESVKSALKMSALREQIDALSNAITGQGTTRDKTTYNTWEDIRPLDSAILEALYANNAIAHIIVDSLVDDGFREGFGLRRPESTPDQDEKEVRAILAEWERLQAMENRFMRGAKWARLFGGGGVLLGVRGSGYWDAPLVDEDVKAIDYIKDVDRQQLRVIERTETGEPLFYEYQAQTMPGQERQVLLPRVHASRIILFPGAVTTAARRSQNDGWDLSVLQACFEPLTSYEAMWANFDNMLSDGSQAVFKLSGLIQALAEDAGGGDVRTRLKLMDLTRSVSNAIILDAGDTQTGAGKEEYQVVERAGLGGLDKVQQNYFTRIASTAMTPESILLGTAPGGDSATGDLERTMWFGRVDRARRLDYQPRVLRLVKLISRALGQNRPDEWEIVWPELEKMSPMDKSTTTKMNVDSMVALITAQAVLPEEVALSLAQSAPDLKLSIDTKSRIKALKLALEELEARELGLTQMENEAEITTEAEVEKAKAMPKPQPTPNSSKRKSTTQASGGRNQGG